MPRFLEVTDTTLARNYLGVPRVNVKDYGAVGDGVTDDAGAINDAFVAASALSGDGQRVKVVIPPGVYACADLLLPKSNITVENQGHLKFTGGDDLGAFVVIWQVENVEIYGGIWDSNFQYNDNTIGITFNDFTVFPQVPGETPVENVFIHDLVIKNARAGIPSLSRDPDDLDWVNAVGGKGITAQIGCKNILISNVVIDDCDIGISIEGRQSDEGGDADSIVIENTIIRDAKWSGLLLYSSGVVSQEAYGTTTSVSLSNVELVDCGTGQSTFDGTTIDIADHFGSIVCIPAYGITGNGVRVRSSAGTKLTVLRGPMRGCTWNLSVFAGGDLVDLIATDVASGYVPSRIASRYNSIRAHVMVFDDFSGYLVHSTDNATYGKQATKSRYEVTIVRESSASTSAAIPTSQYSVDMQSNCVLEVVDLHDGEFGVVDGKRQREVTVSSGTFAITAADELLTVLPEGGVTDYLGTITGAYLGQTVTLINGAANPATSVVIINTNTVANGFNIVCSLNSSKAFLTVRYDGYSWTEVARDKPSAVGSALNFGSVTAQSYADLTITVPGAVTGDCVSLGVPTAAVTAGIAYTAWVSAADTVTVRAHNYTGGALDPASGTFKAAIVR